MAKESKLGRDILYMDIMLSPEEARSVRKKYPDVYRYLEETFDVKHDIPKSEKKLYKDAMRLHMELSDIVPPIANPSNDVKIGSAMAGVIEDMCGLYGHHLKDVFACTVLIGKIDDDKKVPLLIVVGARNELSEMSHHIDDEGDRETVDGLVESLQDIIDRNSSKNPKKRGRPAKNKKVSKNPHGHRLPASLVNETLYSAKVTVDAAIVKSTKSGGKGVTLDYSPIRKSYLDDMIGDDYSRIEELSYTAIYSNKKGRKPWKIILTAEDQFYDDKDDGGDADDADGASESPNPKKRSKEIIGKKKVSKGSSKNPRHKLNITIDEVTWLLEEYEQHLGYTVEETGYTSSIYLRQYIRISEKGEGYSSDEMTGIIADLAIEEMRTLIPYIKGNNDHLNEKKAFEIIEMLKERELFEGGRGSSLSKMAKRARAERLSHSNPKKVSRKDKKIFKSSPRLYAAISKSISDGSTQSVPWTKNDEKYLKHISSPRDNKKTSRLSYSGGSEGKPWSIRLTKKSKS